MKKKLSMLCLMIATLPRFCYAQNIEGQIVASQYGEFKVVSNGNGYTFEPDACAVSGGGKNFAAFSNGVPVKVVDSNPAMTEVSNSTVVAFINSSSCSVSMGGLAYAHTSFYLTSGTGGLQEAINNAKIGAGGPNTIILNAEWYELIAPRSASTVIGSVTGATGFGLVDVTTTPYTTYSWNGSAYTAASSGGSVNSVSVTTANGVSGTVATPTTTPAISLSLGAITPTSVAATGSLSAGSSPPSCGNGATGCLALAQGATVGTPAANTVLIQPNSSATNLNVSFNGGAFQPLGPQAFSGYGTVVAEVHLAAQNASITQTTMYTPSTIGSYRVCANTEITQAATGGSPAMPYVQIETTSGFDNVSRAPLLVAGSSTNATYISSTGCGEFYVAASTPIQFLAQGYAAGTGTPLLYDLEITVTSENASGK
jgi:hypothetical protein